MQKALATAAFLSSLTLPAHAADGDRENKFTYRVDVWPNKPDGDRTREIYHYCNKFEVLVVEEKGTSVKLEDCATYRLDPRGQKLHPVPSYIFTLEDGKVLDIYIQKTDETVLTVDKRKLGRNRACYPDCNKDVISEK